VVEGLVNTGASPEPLKKSSNSAVFKLGKRFG
jgi:hypothetical protein